MLDGYDIPDKATQRGLINTLALLDFLDAQCADAARRVVTLRGLEDKPADKLLAGLRLEVMSRAAAAQGLNTDAYRQAVAQRLTQALAAMPYALIGNDIKEAKQGAGLDVESDLEQCGIGKSPKERKLLARRYFDIGAKALSAAFAGAPEILFVAAAGNSESDASFVEDIPAGIALPNLLAVGAVDQAGDEASFTSHGPTVKVDANGYQVESYLPGGQRVALSGTSMASPQVANLAAKLLAVNPALTPAALIDLIVKTSDPSADGRRHLIDAKKALAAAGWAAP